jgi:hypothetical protein
MAAKPQPREDVHAQVAAALNDLANDLIDSEGSEEWQHPFRIGRAIQRVLVGMGLNPYSFKPEEFEEEISAMLDDPDIFLEVVDVWPKIGRPEGQNIIEATRQRIATSVWRLPLPPEFPKVALKHAELLATWLYWLSDAGQKTCFMGVRTAADILECRATTARIILDLLICHGVIQLVMRYSKQERKANEYRLSGYTGSSRS